MKHAKNKRVTAAVSSQRRHKSVWLTQTQIALLFGVKQPSISKHLINIFKSGELEEDSVHSILEYTAATDTVYHLGASLKDLGKRWFAFSKMEIGVEALRKNVTIGIFIQNN